VTSKRIARDYLGDRAEAEEPIAAVERLVELYRDLVETP